jgi:hypothetical protein
MPRSEPQRERLPNFLVIGAMKAGTTSLYQYLRVHPQVFMASTKEVNFFNPLRNWRRGVGWYASNFEGVGDDVVAVGEASTSYTKYPWIRGVPERIRSVLGDVKLIYLIRDPIERMRSHYLHNLVTGQERRPIERAFSEQPMYLNISRYSMQLTRYLECFPRERLMIVDSRDLRFDRSQTLGRIYDFIGVESSWVPPTIGREYLRSDGRLMKPSAVRASRRVPQLHSIGAYAPDFLKRAKASVASRLPTKSLDGARGEISEDLAARLRDDLRQDVAELRWLMGSDFDGWGMA